MKKNEYELHNPHERESGRDVHLKRMLQEFPVWDVDSRAYANRMMKAMRPKWSEQSWWFDEVFPAVNWRYRLAAYGVVLIAAAAVLYWMQTSPIPAFHSVQWSVEHPVESVDVPDSWKRNLGSGKEVSVPDGIHATVYLRDESVIHCEPQTAFRLDYDAGRNIHIQRGRIEITAAHDPDRSMLVHTPLNTIEVVGTRFTVEVTPKPSE